MIRPRKATWALLAVLGLAGIRAGGAEAGDALDPDKVSIIASTGRDALDFAPGEEMTFTFKVDMGGQTPDGDYFVNWTRDGDDGQTAKGREKLVNGQASMKTSLNQPGFVRIRAGIVDAQGKALTSKDKNVNNRLRFEGGAGVEPDKLAGVPEPADFDAFWQRQKERLAAAPLRAEVTEMPASTDKIKVYAVRVDCAGPRPVTGFLTVPAGAKEKSLPAQVGFFGYGTGRHRAPATGPDGIIDFRVNAHGMDLDGDDEYYKNLPESIRSNGKTYAFDPEQNKDPETAYFNGMALRVMRALEYVKSRPEWNGQRLHVFGGSQGGLQSVWAAGLDPEVTSCTPDIPWCCDMAGHKLLGRLNGWHPEWVDALGYYDAVNHAKRVKCRVSMGAGLGDYTCPPSGVAILYNNFAGPKKITWTQGRTHPYTPKGEGVERFTRERK